MFSLNYLYKHSPRILLVEDNELSQRVTKLVLESLGCAVHVAGEGHVALTMFDDAYALVLMDLGLPDIDGLMVTREIRGRNKHVPIVAATAHASERDRDACYEAGMNAVIMKPLSLEKVKDALLRFVPQQEETSLYGG